MIFLTKMDGYQKMCDTNKNVIKMGVIIKGVYWKMQVASCRFGSKIVMSREALQF